MDCGIKMGYLVKDVYYQPKAFDLTPVGEIEWDEESYQFFITAVWLHADGTIYYADDSGCSCPAPFEDFTSLSDLDKADTVQDLINYLDERLADMHGRWGIHEAHIERKRGEVGELIQQVREMTRPDSGLWT